MKAGPRPSEPRVGGSNPSERARDQIPRGDVRRIWSATRLLRWRARTSLHQGWGARTTSTGKRLLKPRQGGARAGTREVICCGDFSAALLTRPAGRPKATLASRPAGYPPSPVLRSPVAALRRPGPDRRPPRPPRLVVCIPACGDGRRILLIRSPQRSPLYGGSGSPGPCHDSLPLSRPQRLDLPAPHVSNGSR
jgi:hypothetical protein